MTHKIRPLFLALLATAALLVLHGPLFAAGPTVVLRQIDLSEFDDDPKGRVHLFVSVLDERGNPVPGLKTENFLVRENSREVPIDFAGTDQPIAVALAIDTSGSMAGAKLESASSAAETFISIMKPTDRAAIVRFASSAQLVEPATTDKTKLRSALGQMSAGSGTAVWDATHLAGEHLADSSLKIGGRKAVIVLTDGLDNESRKRFSDVVLAAKERGHTVYTIGLGRDQDHDALQRLAAETGGEYFDTPDPAGLERLYQIIATQLRAEYLVTFISTRPVRDGTLRNVEVVVTAPSGQGEDTRDYNPGGVTGIGFTWPAFLGLLAILLLLLVPQGVPDLLERRGIWRRRRLVAQPAPVGAGAKPQSVSGPGPVSPSMTTSVHLNITVLAEGDIVSLPGSEIRQEGDQWIFYPLAGSWDVSFSGDPGAARSVATRNLVKDGSLLLGGGREHRFFSAPPRVIYQAWVTPPLVLGGPTGVLPNPSGRVWLTAEGSRLVAQWEAGEVWISYSGRLGDERVLLQGRNALQVGSRLRLGALEVHITRIGAL